MRLVLLLFLVAGVVAAQSAPPRKDIPTIAKAASGSVVSIVMSDKDGTPIAQGSGFLVSMDGLILTNYHVIAEGSSAIVKLPDGAFYVVDGVLSSDKARDVAVIKAHGENFRPLTLGNSDRLQVGEEIVAIGNPLSLESTVSNGIVSGIRTVEEQREKYLQITAPISPGSSGGPLFNMAGEVIGITTMYLKGGENLNFAIPINDAKRLLAADSKVQRFPVETEAVKSEAQVEAPPNLLDMLQPGVMERAATQEQCEADLQQWSSEEQAVGNKISYAETGARAAQMLSCATQAAAQYHSTGDVLPLANAVAYESLAFVYRAQEAYRLRSYITRHDEWTPFLTKDGAAKSGSVTSAQNVPVEHAATPKQCWADEQAWGRQSPQDDFNLSYAELWRRAEEMLGCASRSAHETTRIDNRPPPQRHFLYELLAVEYSHFEAISLSTYIMFRNEGTQFLTEDSGQR